MKNGNNLSGRKAFGQTLRANRVAEGLGVEALAELLGVSPATVSAWELGRFSPRDHNLARIHEVFDAMEAEAAALTRQTEAPAPNMVKRADVETALATCAAMDDLLVTALSFAHDEGLSQFLTLLQTKCRKLNGYLIAIKAGLRD